MGQVLHGSATTTEAIRRAIQHSQASLRELAKRYGINPKTVAKWKKRGPRSTICDRPEGAAVNGAVGRGGSHRRRLPPAHAVAARRLPLRAAADDPAPDAIVAASLLAAPRHLPPAGDRRRQAGKRKFKTYPIGYFHIDIAEVRTEEGKLYLFVAIDRTSKFAFVELHEKATTRVAADFLRAPDRGRALQDPHRAHRQRHSVHDARRRSSAVPEIKEALADGKLFRAHSFELACAENDIEHRPTKAEPSRGPTARSSE